MCSERRRKNVFKVVTRAFLPWDLSVKAIFSDSIIVFNRLLPSCLLAFLQGKWIRKEKYFLSIIYPINQHSASLKLNFIGERLHTHSSIWPVKRDEIAPNVRSAIVSIKYIDKGFLQITYIIYFSHS